ncbi:SLAP domain-containing protein [Fredinandcohnia onubensis]|uniref:SLAP domain-containing protein n=1 Tax=Fredinandcohnia onubensis TaxID=1571209 RepID=UPI000C0C0D43|nr:SLAP domain-containing protein [Fredinandcohnia onubensis]
MQKLVFEAAWDRTISRKDRDVIEQLFREEIIEEGISFTIIRVAVNHKNERLVTAIVHNRTAQYLVFENTPLQFCDGDRLLVEHEFTLSALQVPPETSMPWTFIFPADGFEIPNSIEHATLRHKKEK